MIGISQTIVEFLNQYQQYSIFKQDEAHYNFSREKGNFSGENGRPEKFTVGILGNVREIGKSREILPRISLDQFSLWSWIFSGSLGNDFFSFLSMLRYGKILLSTTSSCWTWSTKSTRISKQNFDSNPSWKDICKRTYKMHDDAEFPGLCEFSLDV